MAWARQVAAKTLSKLCSLFIRCREKEEVGLVKERELRGVKKMDRRNRKRKKKEWEKRVCFVKHGDFSHVIADSAPQPGCTRIYYFTRAWKTQQIKLWSACLLEMDIFILDFGFSSLKSAFEIVSHQSVASIWGYINLWAHFFLKSLSNWLQPISQY